MSWCLVDDVRAVLELTAPSSCAGCGRPATRWCRACASLLAATPPGPWSPTPRPVGMPPTWSGPAYADEVRAAVLAWKDHGRADLTAVLAPVLRAVLTAALTEADTHREQARAGTAVVLVPAPSARAGTRRRGEHRVAALVRESVHDIPAHRLPVLDALRLRGRVADQAGLSAVERAANLAGAVRVHPRAGTWIVGRPCVLIDDVVTTGATLTECARALQAAGGGPLIAVTLAATRRHATGSRGVLPQPRIAD